jgi:Rrf2 family nitric oxide-sensitive transcriptional repressor
VRASETDFRMVECFDVNHNSCTLTAQCRLAIVFKLCCKASPAERQSDLADITTLPDASGLNCRLHHLSACRHQVSIKMPARGDAS